MLLTLDSSGYPLSRSDFSAFLHFSCFLFSVFFCVFVAAEKERKSNSSSGEIGDLSAAERRKMDDWLVCSPLLACSLALKIFRPRHPTKRDEHIISPALGPFRSQQHSKASRHECVPYDVVAVFSSSDFVLLFPETSPRKSCGARPRRSTILDVQRSHLWRFRRRLINQSSIQRYLRLLSHSI